MYTWNIIWLGRSIFFSLLLIVLGINLSVPVLVLSVVLFLCLTLRRRKTAVFLRKSPFFFFPIKIKSTVIDQKEEENNALFCLFLLARRKKIDFSLKRQFFFFQSQPDWYTQEKKNNR
jgi:hypothetical protein